MTKRTCKSEKCTTPLSKYNPEEYCFVHTKQSPEPAGFYKDKWGNLREYGKIIRQVHEDPRTGESKDIGKQKKDIRRRTNKTKEKGLPD